MSKYEPQNLVEVTDLNALHAKKLKFHVWLDSESPANIVYGITCDKSSKDLPQKAIVIWERELQPIFQSVIQSGIGRQMWTALLENSLYGLHYRSGIAGLSQERLHHIFRQLVYENVIRMMLQRQFPSVWAKKECRLVKSAFDFQDLRSALAIYIAPHDHLTSLAHGYRRNMQSAEDGHVDRVNGIFPCRLVDIFALSRSSGKDKKLYFQRLLQQHNVVEAFHASVKIDLHYHVDEIIFPGVTNRWQGLFAFLRQELLGRRELRSSAPSPYDTLCIMFTYAINKAGSKIEIDVPGGKRDLGETPLQCMHREVWEEIGFHPSEDSQSMAEHLRNIVESSTSTTSSPASSVEPPRWMVWQQEEDPSMASFLLCEYEFSVTTLFPSYRAYIESRHPSSEASARAVESLLPLRDLSYPDHLAPESRIVSNVSTVTRLADALGDLRIDGSSATETRPPTDTATKEEKAGKKHKTPSTKKSKKKSREEPAASDEA